jgi:hypothetical protein
VPADWDDRLSSDVALTLPGEDVPKILLSDWAEVRQAGYERSNGHAMLFCTKLKKAHEYLRGRGATVGPIQEGGGTEFFEVQDPEGNAIEVCKEP